MAFFKNASAIQDTNGNKLEQATVKTDVLKYKFLSSSEKYYAESAGSISFWAMLSNLGLNVAISFML